jgi:hypothetical protein
MGDTTVFSRARNAFWLRVNENEGGSYNLFVSKDMCLCSIITFPKLK